ncbi:chitinase [Microbacterium candidum]|uniref:Chitinase n=1 Tax=Microbacterium candidum TaxID=3041922 RepID=A0ABT7N2D4_9MICO|nr:chitinase [Microbacterium sp. ASV49]MDL9980877.1 chitinase [Microbacterium sp. ASV49]
MRRTAAFGVAVAAAALSLVVGALPASAAGGGVTHVIPAPPLPYHVAAPYVDVTAVGDLATVARDSGSKYLSLAFLQTEAPGSCTPYWAGDTTKPMSADVYGSQISRIRQRGGDVIPSFGGYAADTTNTELSDSCDDVDKIAAALENIFTTYKVKRIDFDIEADSVLNTAGVDRRNAAIAEVQAWGRATHTPVSFSYTLPSATFGLVDSGMAVLASAAAHGAEIASVNIMTFDYWDGRHHDMLADAENAATDLTAQLKATILPNATQRELFAHVGIIQMNGIDDFGPTETYTVDQAKALVDWASRKGLAFMGFWALQRDHGTCPGRAGGWNCSGIDQADWAFTHAYTPFTARR